MCWEYLVSGMLIGIFLGFGLREGISILKHGWAYEEKLRMYDKERK